ncbi:hypothetical protein [Lusitaniella coriacea]|uniref:hypothetical protein n=1 Tax=Lusitaniella coriacea TaxID=1983105 RepID=UPI003CF57AD3
MSKHWKKAIAKIVVWIALEILLTILGLDDLADYSEFVLERNHLPSIIAIAPIQVNVVAGAIG